ncbi:hypothetical protein KC19_7G095000 [Ceratodon purpureus]|uniref:Uncharacterized protein n=1 Tax=Ceratodon purpureus TaxID=3225 RepID=A0A8T0H967_CERPU|nr:hypothetical protein KC19_7G095000 [Ceratodon purpureus]
MKGGVQAPTHGSLARLRLPLARHHGASGAGYFPTRVLITSATCSQLLKPSSDSPLAHPALIVAISRSELGSYYFSSPIFRSSSHPLPFDPYPLFPKFSAALRLAIERSIT